jgi:hypothetical protein
MSNGKVNAEQFKVRNPAGRYMSSSRVLDSKIITTPSSLLRVSHLAQMKN